jgi:nicotinamide mononucleotide transporter
MAVVFEILATAATVIYVYFAIKRSLWQYPVGLVATILFFFVFLDARLYASTALQGLFAAVQVYGWWYWLHGSDGGRPLITSMPLIYVAALCCGALAFAGALSWVLHDWTDAEMAFTDSLIFALSVVAQTLLGRKIIEHWIVWTVVNTLAVFVYASQELWVTAGLYVGLFASTFWGYWEWRQEMHGELGAGRTPVSP